MEKANDRDALGFFGRYLTIWVAACMVSGIMIGEYLPGIT